MKPKTLIITQEREREREIKNIINSNYDLMKFPIDSSKNKIICWKDISFYGQHKNYIYLFLDIMLVVEIPTKLFVKSFYIKMTEIKYHQKLTFKESILIEPKIFYLEQNGIMNLKNKLNIRRTAYIYRNCVELIIKNDRYYIYQVYILTWYILFKPTPTTIVILPTYHIFNANVLEVLTDRDILQRLYFAMNKSNFIEFFLSLHKKNET